MARGARAPQSRTTEKEKHAIQWRQAGDRGGGGSRRRGPVHRPETGRRRSTDGIDHDPDHVGSGQRQGGRATDHGSVKDGQPVGGIQDLTFTEGDDIRFKVDSDVSDEVHFHGYDVGKDVKAGGSVSFDVPATITGVFEVELESRAEQIAEITVNPS